MTIWHDSNFENDESEDGGTCSVSGRGRRNKDGGRRAEERTVVIIGGGVAGLAAAAALVKAKETNFLILEARERLGGRVLAAQVGHERVQLGACWIHGILGNPLYELASSEGLIDINKSPEPKTLVALTEDGKRVPFQLVQEVYSAYSVFLRRCEEYYLAQYEPPEGCDSMKDIDLVELGSFTDLPGGNVEIHEGSLVPEEVASSSTGTTSAMDEDFDEECSDISAATVISKKGETDIDSALLDAETTARKDFLSEDESETSSSAEETNDLIVSVVQVSLEDGSSVLAEHCIVTVPLGVLKTSHSTLFSPALPPYKQEAIERLGFGGVTKIFLHYARPFLHPQLSQILILWNHGSDRHAGSPMFGASTSAAPSWWKKISPAPPPKREWWTKITSFTKGIVTIAVQTLLLTMVAGEGSKEVEALSAEEVGDQCTKVLQKFLGDSTIPHPKQTLCCCKPVLVFAGEHTHSSFYSTLHGAFLTGRAAASLLCPATLHSRGRRSFASFTSSRPLSPSTIEVGSTAGGDLSGWIRGLGLAP
ncbi:unnamed protein product [Cyprideis torosa]|uniref:Amine oxidase domain-containing protein n=1 Tax=Cyprideis torosa TaxID=163714 RepID=A0A7R8W7S1_9CRUS|nr:unnamed protein product [Cyprideis torosa]CAG0887857.1 unnamed protein product [Cyprideis torosa]